jgi:hypothetical protein
MVFVGRNMPSEHAAEFITKFFGGVKGFGGFFEGAIDLRRENFNISELIAQLVDGFNHDEPDLIAQFMDALDEHDSSPRLDIRARADLFALLNQSVLERETYLRERIYELGEDDLDEETEHIREWYSRQLERIEMRDDHRQRLEDYISLFGDRHIFGS